MPERIQDVLLALAFLACGGHHKLLRLLSMHLCNEYLSLPKKKKEKRSLAASFARDTPPRSSDPELLMDPFHCWRHSRLAGLGRD